MADGVRTLRARAGRDAAGDDVKNLRYLSVSIAVLILDQLTKYAIVHGPVFERPVRSASIGGNFFPHKLP